MMEWVKTNGGLIVPHDVALARKRPIAIDLFCGAGGFSLGFMQAGFHVVAGVDNDPAATVTYMYNLGAYPCQFHFATPEDGARLEKFMERGQKRNESLRARASVPADVLPGKGKVKVPTVSGAGWISGHGDVPGVGHFFFGDVRKFTGEQMLAELGLKRGEVDIVLGSPPCQGFSIGGKRNVMDPRNSLVFEFARLVLEIWPKGLVFENVPGILSMITPDGVPVVDALCLILQEGGFGTFDALRRGLLASSGAGGIVRGKIEKPPRDESAGVQPNLF